MFPKIRVIMLQFSLKNGNLGLKIIDLKFLGIPPI